MNTDLVLLIISHLCFAGLGYCVGEYRGARLVIRWRKEIQNHKKLTKLEEYVNYRGIDRSLINTRTGKRRRRTRRK